MGEGAAIILMKRLADAERDGDKIYAVLRGVAGASDGKGKGITAPNPIGQKICIERAWENAGLSPATVTLIEGHGTSTSVGDVVEVDGMARVLREHAVNGRPIALGSVKSNIGHLKGAAGAAGILKAILALHEKVLPPSVRCEHPNPNIDFAHSPLYVNTELRPWTETAEGVRRAGVSAFGFGGTNFHVVLEEYIPHRLTGNGKHSVATREVPPAGPLPAAPEGLGAGQGRHSASPTPAKAPLRGALVTGAASTADLAERLRAVQKSAEAGRTPASSAPSGPDLHAAERIAIDYATLPTWRISARKPSKGSRPTSRQYGRLCARRASSAVTAPRPRWHSFTPGRGRSTSTCCAACARPSPSLPPPSRKPTG